MKRKLDPEPASAPVSAIAARRSQQKLAAASQSTTPAPETKETEGPPSKRTRAHLKNASPKGSSINQQSPSTNAGPARPPTGLESSDGVYTGETGDEYTGDQADEEKDVDVSSEERDSDAPAPPGSEAMQNFLLSKSRLKKKDIVYSTDNAICIRLSLKKSIALIGQYDLWVKRGVVSVMGAKLYASPRIYRVYAPSTHSLPVLKSVSGIEGYAEVEIRSCHQNGLFRLRHLSNLYHRIGNGKRFLPKNLWDTENPISFSILHSSLDDPLNRPLRPLHFDVKWGRSVKSLSQRANLRVLTCGPKGSGKSTFNKYLLNDLLSLLPSQGDNVANTDGVAFLDLDPGQPEFTPKGQVYLAHLRSPVLGPPFSHPHIRRDQGQIIRSHFIGATSPKVDPDHYIASAMDLMNHYRVLLQSYPRCSLVINYPGWIFGLGLEIAIQLIRSLGLTDVVYMSEMGPQEVVEPLQIVAHEIGVPMTILPSQPTEFVTRSSAQLRSMQMMSYFHSIHGPGSTVNWFDSPLCRTRPVSVKYSGTPQGIFGIMVTDSRHHPELLANLLEGAVVGVVVIEDLAAIGAPSESNPAEVDDVEDTEMIDHDGDINIDQNPTSQLPPEESHPCITRTARENLPYLSVGNGTCTPLDPKLSRCLGLAIVRSISPSTETLDLYTPISASTIRTSLEQGHNIVLVRGQLDNPNWALSEEYFSARAAQRRHRRSVGRSKADRAQLDADVRAANEATAHRLRERVRRAGNVPWMKLTDEDTGKEQGARNLWKLRKKAYPADSGGESDKEW